MSIEKGKDIIRKKIVNLTNNPGVYRMLSDKNEILYVGKAKNIPNRLKSYVSESHLPIRTERMLSLTRTLETTTTTNESQALLFEANLKKKHKNRSDCERLEITLKIQKNDGYIHEYRKSRQNDNFLTKKS